MSVQCTFARFFCGQNSQFDIKKNSFETNAMFCSQIFKASHPFTIICNRCQSCKRAHHWRASSVDSFERRKFDISAYWEIFEIIAPELPSEWIAVVVFYLKDLALWSNHNFVCRINKFEAIDSQNGWWYFVLRFGCFDAFAGIFTFQASTVDGMGTICE